MVGTDGLMSFSMKTCMGTRAREEASLTNPSATELLLLQEPEKFAGQNAESAFFRIKYHTILLEAIECFLEIDDQCIFGSRLNYNIIDIRFYIVPNLGL